MEALSGKALELSRGMAQIRVHRPKHLSLMVPTPQHQGMMSRIKDSQAPGSTRTRIEHPSIAAWCTPHVQQRIAPNATSDRNGRLCG
ncbi:hypothetical protein HBI38_068480 [Parastagonospora nodorum]|nr:hypothetical protein HBH47_046600 [Parastagonospora nodorum]KAH4224000.1 hypothetical protein HBI06_125670 [Parastagonospora nodorum]KAH4424153.1 hypothetical protein HBH93_191210 [Parastagonospora nodorum]KAH4690524.1 hypothetical protein HBH78_086540 [Parastagonospora nodorum]KAH4796516.1 hypothetical protein HBH63_077490 [Parastagonospora nodorum]